MRPFSFKTAAAVAVTILGLTGCAITDEIAAPAETFVIATGNYGGVYYPFGTSVCRLWNGDEGLASSRCVAVASNGSVDNAARMKSDRASYGMIQADVAAHMPPGFKVVLAGPVESFAVVLNPAIDVTRLQQLKGKRMAIGAEGSGVRETTRQVFATMGWTERDIAVVSAPSTGQQARMLCQGKLDATVFVAATPSGYISEAALACGGIVMGPDSELLDRMLDNRHYIRTVIPKDSYRNQRADIQTFGVRSYLVAQENEPEERVYRLTKLLLQELEQLWGQHPALKSLSKEQLLVLPPELKRHSGAQRYLVEAGLAK